MILSPSPPPQSSPPVPSQPPTDTHIGPLKAIFPDFDDAVILSVLQSTNNDHDRALDVLLGMNDPSFVPPTPPPSHELQSAQSSDAERLSQEALDEQLARRLALEEEQATTQPWPPQGVEGQTTYQAYQPRRGRDGSGGPPLGQPQTQGQGGRDTMAEFQEGFNRIAESGKKTFTSIVSKVKAKLQEFDQGQGRSNSSGVTQNPPNQTSAQALASYYPSHAPGQQQGPGRGSYAQSYQPTQPVNTQKQTNQSLPARTNASPPRSGVMHPSAIPPASSQKPSYYDPNARGYDLYADDEEDQTVDKNSTPLSSIAATQSIYGSAIPPPPSNSTSPPSYSSPPSNSRPSSITPPARSLSPTSDGSLAYVPPGAQAGAGSARSGTPGTPGAVDFSKLGLLPKRPISLVRPQSPTASGGGGGDGASGVAPHSESTNVSTKEPEFVENPFEERT